MAGSQGTLQDTAFVERLLASLLEGNEVPAAFVLDVRRSMPRDPGAVLVLLEDGFLGTVGGGAIERMVEQRLQGLSSGEPGGLDWYTHEDTAMACGGDALVGFTVLGPGQLPFLEELLAALEAGEPVWSLQDWSGEAPAFRLLRADDLLHGSEDLPLGDRPAWLEARSLFVEPIGVIPCAHIFGAGHVGRALTPVLASVGFLPFIYDDRPAMATPEAFPQAAQIVVGDFTQIAADAPVLPGDYVVVLTHGHVADIDVLAQVLPKGALYVGCIGSRRKSAIARKTLLERGLDPVAVERTHMPIGDKIGAVTPAEIAVSIAAQMIRCRAEAREQ